MDSVTIYIDGEVQAQERPYVVTDKSPYKRLGKSKNKSFNRKASNDYRTYLQRMAHGQYQDDPFDQPIKVTILVVRTPPESWSAKKKQEATFGQHFPATRPDVDNYAKGILDAMNGILWKDDNIICDLHISKRYGSVPKVYITVEKL